MVGMRGRVDPMTEQQKQSLRIARLPGHRTTSAEAYAQMTILMGTPVKMMIGKSRNASGGNSGGGARHRG
jgi:hypothetical protein